MDTNAFGYYLSAFYSFTTAKEKKFHTRVQRTHSLDRLAVEISFMSDLLLFVMTASQ